MATHAPVATDCRFMLVASKISSNLERIANQATAIARRSLELNKEPLLKPLIDIPRMAQIAEGMLRDGITALIERKPELAQEVVKRDKEVDQINKQLARELTSFMLEDPSTITRALSLTIVARCLERVADHCKNIAEEVYYLYQAIDIRRQTGAVILGRDGSPMPSHFLICFGDAKGLASLPAPRQLLVELLQEFREIFPRHGKTSNESLERPDFPGCIDR